ncbi:MAG TPA: PIN domain-containing protein, partial [Pyrinomonadaceae bacterium]
MFQIVIDTNVLLAGLRSKRGASYRLLSLIGDARWQLNLSVPLLLEYEDVLKRPEAHLSLTPTDIDDI